MKTKTLLFCGFFLFSKSDFSQISETNYPLDWQLATIDSRIASVVGKVTLTDSVLSLLLEEKINSTVFYLLTTRSLREAPARLAKYEKYFQNAATQTYLADSTGWAVKWLQAKAFIESGGQAKAKSKAGAIGVMQILPATGKSFGASYSALYNPEKNILCGTRYFAYLYRLFAGRKCLATASYHMGQQNMFKLIELALAEFYNVDTTVNEKNSASIITAYNISYPQMYFAAKPTGKLYAKAAGLKDYSMEYCFKVMAAERLLLLDSASYNAMYERIAKIAEKPYRFFSWCQETEFWEDEIVVLPFSTKKLYEFLAWPETAPEDEFIGEIKFQLSREGVGAAIAIAVLYRELLKQNNLAFDSFGIYEAYDVPVKCKDFAFTIEGPSGGGAAKLFHFVLKRLASLGFLSYKEDGTSYLVVATPEKEKKEVLENMYLLARDYK